MERAERATADDLHVLETLWDHAVAELDGQRGGHLLAGSLVRPDLPGFLASCLRDADRLLVVGFIDTVPIGMGSVVCDRLRREPIANLELLFVEPDGRQIGVAEAMIEVVSAWAREKGCVGVDAPALPGNRAAKAFFETHGFLARLLVMHRPVTGGADG